MSELEDYELDRRPDDGGPRRGFPTGLVTAGVLLVAGISWIGFLAFRRSRVSEPVSAPSETPAALTATPSPPPTPDPTLPSLDDSDTFVRDLAKALSSHPQIALWLQVKGLVRKFVAVVENVADGASPRSHLEFLAPKQAFAVLARRGQITIDPRSYQRYDGFADGVASLDAPAAAQIYRRLEPLFEIAYRELGHPEGGFRAVLDRAFGALLEVPEQDGDVPVKAVVKAVVVYEYADPRLEALTPAQKQLLRTGPRNVRLIKNKLRELKGTLGRP